MNETISHPGCETISHAELGKILLSKKRTIPEIMEYFANQYYIYGEDRSHFTAAWTNDLRLAIIHDYIRTEPDPTQYFRYFSTKHVLNKVFNHISEITAYQVEERHMIETICEMVKNAFELKEKNNFKNTLAGKHEVTNW